VVVNVALRWIFAAAAARLLTRWADDDHGLRPRVLPISLLLLLRQVLLLLLALLTAFEFQSSAEGGIAEKGRDEAVTQVTVFNHFGRTCGVDADADAVCLSVQVLYRSLQENENKMQETV
jgi:hypothetical protein